MKLLTCLFALGLGATSLSSQSVFAIKLVDIDGNQKTLADYKGKVVLIVNTASLCGYTPQYEALESMYKEYKTRGFEILAFPSNDFLGQEPGSNEEIKAFCTLNYDVSFQMFSKTDVVGGKIHPLFKWLTSSKDKKLAGPVTWNFNKFLLDREGNLVYRFDSKVTPDSAAFKAALRLLL